MIMYLLIIKINGICRYIYIGTSHKYIGISVSTIYNEQFIYVGDLVVGRPIYISM